MSQSNRTEKLATMRRALENAKPEEPGEREPAGSTAALEALEEARESGQAVHAYAGGGDLTEPVVGQGLASGDSYLLGENGPEQVTPLSGPAGQPPPTPGEYGRGGGPAGGGPAGQPAPTPGEYGHGGGPAGQPASTLAGPILGVGGYARASSGANDGFSTPAVSGTSNYANPVPMGAMARALRRSR